MGGDASRVGKICSYYLAGAVFPSFIYPDAGRVAPISACVWCLRFFAACFRQLKPPKNGLIFDANFEHPTYRIFTTQQ